MNAHKSVADFLDTSVVKEELKDKTNANIGTDTSIGGAGENLSQQSGGSDTGGSTASIGTGTGADGKQANTNNNAGGLGDVKVDVAPQNPAVGAGDKSSKPSDKKGTKPTGK